MIPKLATGLLLIALDGCTTPASPTSMQDRTPPVRVGEVACAPDPTLPTTVEFERSPGGTPEVSSEFLARHHCSLRVIDVREKPELMGELGHIEGATWVPLRALAREAEAWDRHAAIVLVDRSGRRSGRAAMYLAAEGFSRAASLTGGMIAWNERGLPVTRAVDFGVGSDRESSVAHQEGPLTIEDIEIHIGDPKQVRWTKAATLLLHGTESCVDGRDDHAVIGTPGGDAGELLAGLATMEKVTGATLTTDQVAELFDGYVDAFGHFYMHTDDHALAALGARLRGHAAFAGLPLGELHMVEDLVRHPPRAKQEALMPLLSEAAHIGCGHLRLVTQHPEEYGVPPKLVEAFFRAFFRRLWRGDERLEYVVLEGEHEEGAVVNITLGRDVHPYTEIPMVAPKHQGQEMFVNHPQVASFIRRQNATFLLEKLPLADGADDEAFLEALNALAQRQLESTVRYLADELPVFEVAFHGRDFELRRVR